jgi:hypothetical protein
MHSSVECCVQQPGCCGIINPDSTWMCQHRYVVSCNAAGSARWMHYAQHGGAYPMFAAKVVRMRLPKCFVCVTAMSRLVRLQVWTAGSRGSRLHYTNRLLGFSPGSLCGSMGWQSSTMQASVCCAYLMSLVSTVCNAVLPADPCARSPCSSSSSTALHTHICCFWVLRNAIKRAFACHAA